MTGLRGEVRVTAGGTRADYVVRVEPGVSRRLAETVRGLLPPGGTVAVISDSNVLPLHGEAVAESLRAGEVEVRTYSFPAGERHKTRESWAALTDAMLEAGHGRDTMVVAVGGGVTGDLAGFVAATYLRGVSVIQVPTSALAMIDASVGGKTGVDVQAGKNLVGAFYPPRMVAVDPETLQTLPRSERVQGLAEAIKHAAILDQPYMERLGDLSPSLLAGDVGAWSEVVLRSVELKAEVVSRDEREGGLRQILNFGHTLGHALEAESGYELPHGSAVSIGMVLEARLGEQLGVTAAGTSEVLSGALEGVGLPTGVPGGTDPHTVLARTRGDKKVRGGRARYVLLEKLGRVSRGRGWAREVGDSAVLEVLRS